MHPQLQIPAVLWYVNPAKTRVCTVKTRLLQNTPFGQAECLPTTSLSVEYGRDCAGPNALSSYEGRKKETDHFRVPLC